jgi:hypothetical protein
MLRSDAGRLREEDARRLAGLGEEEMPKGMNGKRVTLSGREAAPGFEDAPAPAGVGSNGQNKDYWVLSAEERAKGFVRPVRHSYTHDACKGSTRMARAIAETYARDPKFYGATFCVHCKAHFPVSQFLWDGTDERVGS